MRKRLGILPREEPPLDSGAWPRGFQDISVVGPPRDRASVAFAQAPENTECALGARVGRHRHCSYIGTMWEHYKKTFKSVQAAIAILTIVIYFGLDRVVVRHGACSF